MNRFLFPNKHLKHFLSNKSDELSFVDEGLYIHLSKLASNRKADHWEVYFFNSEC